MGQPEVGWGGVCPNPIGLPQRPSDSDYDRRCGQCEVRGVPGDVHIDEFISPKPVWTLGIFTLQPFSLMPPVAAPDLSSRPGPRARFTLVRPGEATVILKCPGRRYHSVERVADSMFFGVSTWTFRFLNFLLAVSWLFPRIVAGSNVSYLMLQKAAVLDNNAACNPAKW